MDGHDDSVMIALLPTTTDWSRLEIPHMTLVFAGKKDELKPTDFNEMAKDASSIAMLANPLFLKVMGTEVFGGGDEPQVNVLTLRPSQELMAMRKFVEFWNASEFDFKPHATIGPVNSFVETTPDFLVFDKIAVCWGKEHLVFRFKDS